MDDNTSLAILIMCISACVIVGKILSAKAYEKECQRKHEIEMKRLEYDNGSN